MNNIFTTVYVLFVLSGTVSVLFVGRYCLCAVCVQCVGRYCLRAVCVGRYFWVLFICTVCVAGTSGYCLFVLFVWQVLPGPDPYRCTLEPGAGQWLGQGCVEQCLWAVESGRLRLCPPDGQPRARESSQGGRQTDTFGRYLYFYFRFSVILF